MLIQHNEDYRKVRASKYPPIADQLDAVMKMASALKEQGMSLPEATINWIDQCQAVKSTYPKG